MEILANIVLIILIISSFILIAAILILPPKENSMGQAIGGSEDLNLFGKKKSHGAIALLERIVIASSATFMISAFIYYVLYNYIN